MDSSQKTTVIVIVAMVIIVAGLIGVSVFYSNQPGTHDVFAQCLTEKGATFYGAFWCPHCQATKALFGKSIKYVKYVECSTPDGSGQLQVCKDKNIETYPTWEFADGSRLTGELSLQELSDKTSCPLTEGQQPVASNQPLATSSPIQ
ncbi:MAG: thioredoxin domain-containing protein [Candidatus Pacebacteria bacterium]|nr:thioredoxin domain-containing protein [Candidatus Paceibacterota bacterium]MDD5356556.1 thioredoxin domain-containing protein [Candidatus Paceibacterota bacterium]